MENEKLEKLRKSQKYCFVAASIGCLSALLQYNGIFFEGNLPWYTGLIGAFLFIIAGINSAREIRSVENKNR